MILYDIRYAMPNILNKPIFLCTITLGLSIQGNPPHSLKHNNCGLAIGWVFSKMIRIADVCLGFDVEFRHTISNDVV